MNLELRTQEGTCKVPYTSVSQLHVQVLQKQQGSSDLHSTASKHLECVARPGLFPLPVNLPEFRTLPWARPLEVPTTSTSLGCKEHAAEHKQLGNLASVPGALGCCWEIICTTG